jgi:hypothetical protein
LKYEEVPHQRAVEIRLTKELDLELLDGAGSVAAVEAGKVAEHQGRTATRSLAKPRNDADRNQQYSEQGLYVEGIHLLAR